MDVNDHSLRLDVLPAGILFTTDASSAAKPDPATLPFADAFQRRQPAPSPTNTSTAQGNSASDQASGSLPTTAASENNSQTPKSGALNDSDQQQPSAASTPSPTNPTPMTKGAKESNGSATDAGDHPAQETTTTAAESGNIPLPILIPAVPPPVVNTPVANETPVAAAAAPASLVKAWQQTTPPLVVEMPAPSVAEEPSSIPAGLQAALSNALGKESPSDSPLNADVATKTAIVPSAASSTIAARQSALVIPPASVNIIKPSTVGQPEPIAQPPGTPAKSTTATIPIPTESAVSDTINAAVSPQAAGAKNRAVRVAASEESSDRPVAATPTISLALTPPVLDFSSKTTITTKTSTEGPPKSVVAPSPGGSLSVENLPQISPMAMNPTGDLAAPISLDPTTSTSLLSAGGPADPPVHEQVQSAMQRAAGLDQQLTIVLRPPELGRVQIDVIRQDGQVSARLQTETATAHRLLSDHLPQLQESFAQMGLTADQVQIVRSDPLAATDFPVEPYTDGRMDQQHGNSQQEQSQAPPPEPQWIDEPESVDNPVRNIWTRTALNLRV